jgi:hypothetical protein
LHMPSSPASAPLNFEVTTSNTFIISVTLIKYFTSSSS